MELTPAPLWTGVPSASSSTWTFREDRARYSEEQSGSSPLAPLVQHTLVMEFPATKGSRSIVEGLITACRTGGVVAVVTMASGEKIVAGSSIRFGAGYPLRMVKIESTSGRTPADFPTIAVTLESIDADPASSLV